ncbi:MAG TPA: deoxynucleoside kinase [Saprospiraceae bacterium]|nr:deoxynucleoside kinase [Saprospiraceae bacterium]HRP42425.1 deoxynucleoside kinase [Saprospiraceae bacterium]
MEGNIGAGKTTFCHMLKDEYNCRLLLEEFGDNPFLPLFYEDPKRFAFTVELFFMTERHEQMERNLMNQDLFHEFTVADYTFIKTLLFASKNLTNEKFRLFQKMFQVLNQSLPKPDLLVYFHRSVDLLMEHIKKRGRDYEKFITEAYLSEIQNSYFEYFRNILSYPILIIDLDTVDFVNNKAHYEQVKYIISKKYNPGVHRISLVL